MVGHKYQSEYEKFDLEFLYTIQDHDLSSNTYLYILRK